MAEVAQVIYLASLGASGTANPNFALPAMTREVIITVACEYAAVAGTTGVNAGLSVSYNNGGAYSASAQASQKVPGVAATLEQETIVYRMGDDPFHPDQAFPTNLEINLTNTDATNAAVTTVVVQAITHSI
jgi:hypothetical protein